MIASSAVLGPSYQLFKERLPGEGARAAEPELCAQLLHLYLRLLRVEPARDELLYSTRIVSDALVCMKLPHPPIRTAATLIADIGTVWLDSDTHTQHSLHSHVHASTTRSN